MISNEKLTTVLNKMSEHKRIFSAVLSVENGDGSFSWTGAVGAMKQESRFFIASVTKLYVTAVVMRLVQDGRLALSDRICDYLPETLCKGIHVINGIDYSDWITICHLISNTSGLPDYFFYKQPGGKTVADALMDGNDEPWPLERTIDLIKNLKPNFKPGAKGKATYSDSNYQLLGAIIEVVTGKSIAAVFDEFLIRPLNLHDTYVYNDVNDTTPVPFYFRDQLLELPRYMASIGPEGGIVSTAREVMAFLKGFFAGRFFPCERIGGLKVWNLILPPPGLFFFGIGLEKIWTPRIISPFKPITELLGFWGQTGSFAFYNPDTDLYFCGTTNQINGQGHMAAGSAMLKLIKAAL